ncbi:MAG: hydroxyacylglutathione hydrolase [Gemmobacter sp.]
MPLTLATVPCLADNYAFLAHDPETGATACVDVPDADPILAELRRRGWRLTDILLTHHHDDHTAGVAALVAATGAAVTGAAADAHRLPPLDRAVAPGDGIAIGGNTGRVIAVPGHTLGHVAFLFDGIAFTADSLMAAGCGRLFEGTAADMHGAFAAFDALADETLICSGHEYTAANIRFALTLEPDNAALISRAAAVADARDAGRPTVPSTLGEERATNPYLRVHLPAVAAAIGLQGAAPAEVFAAVRAAKDRF